MIWLPEEELKRLHAAGYGQVGFNYENTPEPTPVPSLTEADEPFVPLPELKALLPDDIVLPDSVKLNAIIEKTAKFIASQGAQMEILLRAKQADNVQFQFLTKDSPLHPYYEALTALVKAGKWPEKKEEVVEADCDYTMLISKIKGVPPPEEKYETPLAPGELPPPGTETLRLPPPAEISKPPVMYIHGMPTDDRSSQGHLDAYNQYAAYYQQYAIPAQSQVMPNVGETKRPISTANAKNTITTPSKSTGLSLMRHYNTDSDTDNSDSDDSAEENGPPVLVPPEEVQVIIDKMATYVARNGDEFAEIVRAKNDPRFTFLDPGHEYYPFYKRLMDKTRAGVNGVEKSKEEGKKSKAKLKALKKTIMPVSFSIKKLKEPEPVLPKPALPYESSSDEESENKQIEEKPKEILYVPQEVPVVPKVPQLLTTYLPQPLVYKIEPQEVIIEKPKVEKPVVIEKPVEKPQEVIVEAIVDKAVVLNNIPIEKEIVEEKIVVEKKKPLSPRKPPKEEPNYRRDKKKSSRKREYRAKSESRDRKRSRRSPMRSSEDRDKRRHREKEKRNPNDEKKNLTNDDCLYGMKEYECGLRMDVKCLLYADDQVILAPSACGLQEMVNKMNDYVKKRGMKVNVSKTKVMVFERGDSTTEYNILIEDESVRQVKVFAYLGREGETEVDRTKQLERRRRAAEFLHRVGVDNNSLASAMVETLQSLQKKKQEEEERKRRHEKRRHRDKYDNDEDYKRDRSHRKSKRRKNRSPSDKKYEDNNSDYDRKRKRKKDRKRRSSSKSRKRRSAKDEESEELAPQKLNIDLSNTLKELRSSPTRALGLENIEENSSVYNRDDTSGSDEEELQMKRKRKKKKKEDREYSEGEWASSDSGEDSNSSRSKTDD
ncbi:Protein suppressor of white apricot [Eumeta japonica]|uniref:Protein suppressor of white apricot n=1 Tax=Eumeta variegata TaxID=151549 RepID=A0A4C1VAS0_EUMVA|nr:Protein suppressor of white apricot [Eumeta japonica]